MAHSYMLTLAPQVGVDILEGDLERARRKLAGLRDTKRSSIQRSAIFLPNATPLMVRMIILTSRSRTGTCSALESDRGEAVAFGESSVAHDPAVKHGTSTMCTAHPGGLLTGL
jgi:hypothetical protein